MVKVDEKACFSRSFSTLYGICDRSVTRNFFEGQQRSQALTKLVVAQQRLIQLSTENKIAKDFQGINRRHYADDILQI